MARLGDLCKKESSSIAQKDLEKNNGMYPIYGASGFIKNVDFYKQQKPYIAIVKDGAGVGRVMKLPAKSSIIGTMQYIIPNDDVNTSYLAYAIEHMHLEKYYMGAAIPHIYFKDYCKETLNSHNYVEQQKIAERLDLLSNLIENQKQQLEKLDELVKSQFIEMFGDLTLGEKKWPYYKLGNLCKIYRGGSPRPISSFLGGDVPWIKIGDATDGDNIYLKSTKEHIIQEGVRKSRMVKAGSLIFANCGVSLGFARIITFDGCIHDGWLSFEDIDDRLDKIFLLKSLNQMTEYFRAMAPKGTQPNLNTKIMSEYLQVLPPLSLQREFVEIMTQTDKSKFEIQQSIEKLETLKKSLMQEYFG